MNNYTNMYQRPGYARMLWVMLSLVLLLLTGCKDVVDLQTGLTDAEANEIIAVLQADGIAASKQSSKLGVAVSVPAESLARATIMLKSRGLPQRRQARLGDVFKKDGLISTPMEERARYISALSQELEYTLAQIDGVVVARVHVVLPEKVAPGEPVQPSSAAVFVKHTVSLDPDIISPRIRHLVARSIPGLGGGALDKISVVFVEGRPEPAKVVEEDNVGRNVQLRLLALAVLLLAVGGFAATFAGKPRLSALLGRLGLKT
jgi:type III secretion protein J